MYGTETKFVDYNICKIYMYIRNIHNIRIKYTYLWYVYKECIYHVYVWNSVKAYSRPGENAIVEFMTVSLLPSHFCIGRIVINATE